MMPNAETPYGMLIEKAQNVRALASSQGKMAADHDAQAKQCRDLEAGLLAKAKLFEDAAKRIQAAEAEVARLAALKRA